MDELIKSLLKFNILEQTQWSARAAFEVSEKLPFFSGHFPNNPILPAVSIIDITLLLMSHLGYSVSHTDILIRKSKFMVKILPKQKIIITLEGDESGIWNSAWLLESDQTKLVSIGLEIPSDKSKEPVGY